MSNSTNTTDNNFPHKSREAMKSEMRNKAEKHSAQQELAWDAIRELSGGNLAPARDEAPSMIVFDVNGRYDYRWFGQKLPKNAVPVGVVNDKGRFVAGLNVELPEDFRRRVSILHGFSSGADNEFRVSTDEVSQTALAELVKLAKEKHSDSIPPWSYRLGVAVTIDQLAALHAERTGNITDDKNVVVANYDRYDILDLCVWMVDHLDEVSDAELAAFLFQGAKFNGAAWMRQVCLRIGLKVIENGRMLHRIHGAHTAAFGK